MDTAEFFLGQKVEVVLFDTPKLSRKKTTITLGFAIPLTGKTIGEAPENVKEAFYAVQKDNLGINPVGIDCEFDEVNASFYATTKTVAPSLEVSGCQVKKLEVARPSHKTILDDGDVKLSFRLVVPASSDAWRWSYSNFGSTLAVVFEELQLRIPSSKPAEGAADDGQGELEMPTDAEPEPEETTTKKSKPKSKKKSKK